MNKFFTLGKRRLKTAGLVILAFPILFLAAFAIGEGLSPEFGINGFLLHFSQVLPLLAIFYVACLSWLVFGGVSQKMN